MPSSGRESRSELEASRQDLDVDVSVDVSVDVRERYRFLDQFDANDDPDRREWVHRDGTAFAGDHADVWGYNDRNELDDSDRYNTFDPNNPGSPSDPNHAFDRAYAYDPIGNREWYKEGTDPNTAYTANNLNQYTATQDPNESFTYDDDGNLTTACVLTSGHA